MAPMYKARFSLDFFGAEAGFFCFKTPKKYGLNTKKWWPRQPCERYLNTLILPHRTARRHAFPPPP